MTSPVFDGIVKEDEWVDAAKLEFNFTFATGESHKADVYLVRNDSHFFAGVIIRDLGPNPFTVPDKAVFPDGFEIYFEVDNDGKLTQPEDGKGQLNFIGFRNGSVYFDTAISKDSFWESPPYPGTVSSWQLHRPEINGEVSWTSDENVKASDISVHPSGYYSGGISGDEHFEFTFPLTSNDTVADGFQVSEGESKIMGFALEFYRQTYSYENGTEGQDLYDYWPGEGFTPNVIINPSEWAKLSIGLGTATNNFLDPRIILTIVAIIIIILIISMWIAKHK